MAYWRVQVSPWFMKILGICGTYNAVNWYRIVSPIGNAGGDLSFKYADTELGIIQVGDVAKNVKELGDKYFSAYDLVVVKYIATKEDAQSFLHWKSQAPDTKVYFDIDDNVFEIPKGNSAEQYWGEDEQGIFAYMIQQMDGLFVSTEALKDYLLPLNSNITVMPNRIDTNMWKKKRKSGSKVRIGWSYSPTHFNDKNILEGVFGRLKDKYGDSIEFEATILEEEGLKTIEAVPNKDFPKLLCDRRWDIAIGPLEDIPFNHGKSCNKWLESSMAGSVFVGSAVEPYNKAIEHGKTGFLCKDDEWFDTLCMLIEDKKLRQKVQKAAEKVVRRDYDINTSNPYKDLELGAL